MSSNLLKQGNGKQIRSTENILQKLCLKRCHADWSFWNTRYIQTHIADTSDHMHKDTMVLFSTLSLLCRNLYGVVSINLSKNRLHFCDHRPATCFQRAQIKTMSLVVWHYFSSVLTPQYERLLPFLLNDTID